RGFTARAALQVAEGLDTSWVLSFAGRLTDPSSPMTLHAAADVSGFQLLWGAYFVDGGKLTSKLDVVADLTRGAAPAPTATATTTAITIDATTAATTTTSATT